MNEINKLGEPFACGTILANKKNSENCTERFEYIFFLLSNK